MRILLVEDHPLVGDGLQRGLTLKGFAVDWVSDGVAARHALATGDYAAMVLDIGLPRLSGLELLQQLRERGNAVPVLMLTARDAKQDKLIGLNSGADDYVTKPADLDELAARLHALIRRSAGRASPRVRVGEVEFDPSARQVWLGGKPIDLAARELAVLETLMDRAGRVVSRAQLEASIYGFAEGVESNAVEVYVHQIRKKLGAHFIKTVRGLGYSVGKKA
jgi:two-component system response regulator QseB